MENYSRQSSGGSSPLSRDIDCENPPSWEEPPAPASYKVKFMCSYGGKIQPRPHDNQLAYVGGDTKILSVERSISFSAVLAKLSSICDAPHSEICFKYQLPGEELDALISVTNDEDLEHLMSEYDRLNRISPKPARLRIFLFPVNLKPNSDDYLFKEAKPEGSWFVDALNSVQFRPLDDSSPPPPPPNPESANPDFLFGFDKAMNYNSGNEIPDLNEQVAVGEPVASIQSQMERFLIRDGEEVSPNGNTTRIYQSEYYQIQEKASPAPPPPQTVPVPISSGYWPEMQISAGNYQLPPGIPADQQPIYLIQTPTGALYHQQGAYYSVPRMMPESYGEHPAYSAVPPPSSSLIQQQQKITGMQDGMGAVRQQPLRPAMVSDQQGYSTQYVSYVDNAGRPVYYTMAPPPPYQVVNAAGAAMGADGRAGGGVGIGVDSKVVAGKAPQTSS